MVRRKLEYFINRFGPRLLKARLVSKFQLFTGTNNLFVTFASHSMNSIVYNVLHRTFSPYWKQNFLKFNTQKIVWIVSFISSFHIWSAAWYKPYVNSFIISLTSPVISLSRRTRQETPPVSFNFKSVTAIEFSYFDNIRRVFAETGTRNSEAYKDN